jgi:peptidoglycan hydrolase CwlO-like protein
VTRRRWVSLLALLLATVVVAVGAPQTGAYAAPNPAPKENDEKKLRDNLEAAAKGQIEAKRKLDDSKRRAFRLNKEVAALDTQVDVMRTQVGVMALESYRTGRLTPLSALLNSTSPEDLLDRAGSLEMMAQRDAGALRGYQAAHEAAQQAKAQLDAEVQEQKKQVATLTQRKADAERALRSVGGGTTSAGYINPNSPAAQPAKRNSDGSWPSESCSVDDPTPASGCITPRTLHAMREAQADGFKRYVSCHRSGGGGEHPKGRACDFSAAAGGFQNKSATGGDKTYGDNLASYFIKNADALGVLYVIWYRRIWMPGTGWKSYNGGSDPAANHTNHVHLSML